MSRPLRVLFLATYFPKPGNPLIGTWALAQAQALARRPDLDLRVISCNSYVPRVVGNFSAGASAYARCPSAHDWDGLRVEYPRWLVYPDGATPGWAYKHPTLPLLLGWLSARGALERAMRQHRPDVIYAHHTGANGYLAWQLNRHFGVPYVITDHLFGDRPYYLTMPERYAVFTKITERSSRMIAVSQRMKTDTQGAFPRARTLTVHNGATPPPSQQWQTPRPPEIAGKTVILSAGMLYPSKGFPALVQAWSRIATRFPNAVLRIAGEGSDRAAIDAAIKKFGVSESVQMLGALPHAQIAQEMIWADIFALISREDPFPTVILEALAAAKPLVWPDDSGINDVLQDGVQGLKVPSHHVEATARALEQLLCDQERRLQMGRAAKELSQSRLTWDANAAIMAQIFRETVAENAGDLT